MKEKLTLLQIANTFVTSLLQLAGLSTTILKQDNATQSLIQMSFWEISLPFSPNVTPELSLPLPSMLGTKDNAIGGTGRRQV